jgi:hypothetical protein
MTDQPTNPLDPEVDVTETPDVVCEPDLTEPQEGEHVDD